MTKPGDLQTKKTIYELAKEFPNKIYKELEKYRDADRREEAQRIFIKQENEELKEDQHKEDWKTYGELETKIKELRDELDRVKKENNDLYNRIAKLSERDLQKARESGL